LKIQRKERLINFSKESDPDVKRIVLHGVEVPYIVRVNKRARQIILRMRSDKLVRITVPPGIRNHIVESVLKDSAASILEQYKKIDALSEVYLHKGKPLTVVSAPSTNTFGSVRIEGDTIYFTTVTGSREEKLALYKKLLLKTGKVYLHLCCAEMAVRYRFRIASVSVRHMRSRWGSCNSKGVITLNAALMQCPQDIIDYVIIHELCHTRFPDHSPRFWMEVEKYLPDYRDLRGALKKYNIM